MKKSNRSFFVQHLIRIAVFAGIGACFISSTFAAPIKFDITYLDANNEGFNDATLGLKRKAALNHATGIWSNIIDASYAGETIRIGASFDALGGTANSAQMAQGGVPYTLSGFQGSMPNTLYVPSLANHLAMKDLPTPSGQPNYDIRLIFNTDVDGDAVMGKSHFFYGNPAPGQGEIPAADFDFVTIALHEIAHGLGFFSNIKQDGSYNQGKPMIYDRFLQNKAGKHLDQMTDAQRKTAIKNFVSWDSKFGTHELGAPFELYSPANFNFFSSLVHLDPSIFAIGLMTPAIDIGGLQGQLSVTHNPIVPERIMLKDIGWTVRISEPRSHILLFIGLLSLALVQLKRRAHYSHQQN